MQITNEGVEVKVSSILLMLLVFIIPPAFFSNYSVFDKINNILLIIIFLILLLLTIFKKKLNIYVLLIFIFLLWNTLSSYFLADGVLDFFNNLKVISIVLLVNVLIKNHFFSLLKALNTLFSIYIYINFISYILFPNGLYLDNPRENQFREAWFLGIENQFAYIIVPGITIALLYSFYRYKKINLNSIILIFVSGMTLTLSWSATAIVSYAFLIASFFFAMWKGINQLYNFKLLLITYIISWFIVVKINSYNVFKNIIEGILNKDMTFSSRTLIWDKIFELIPSSKWYGFGNNTYVLVFNTKEFRAHNLILQIVLDNGLISLFVFLVILTIAGTQLRKYRGNFLVFIILIGMFGILIGGLAESYRLNNLFLLITLAVNCRFIINNQKLDLRRSKNNLIIG